MIESNIHTSKHNGWCNVKQYLKKCCADPPYGESKSARSRATAINVFGILALGTNPYLAVCCHRIEGYPAVVFPGAGG